MQVGATIVAKAPSVHKTVLEPDILEPDESKAEQVSVQRSPEPTSESEQDEV